MASAAKRIVTHDGVRSSLADVFAFAKHSAIGMGLKPKRAAS